MTQSTFLKAITGLMVWFVVGQVVMGCNLQDIMEKVFRCSPKVSILEFNEINIHTKLLSYCKGIECNISCVIDAVGDCYLQDAFFQTNPDVYKATSRAFCNNQTETKAVYVNCRRVDNSCLRNFSTAVEATGKEHKNRNYMAFKAQYCSAIKTLKGCIEFSVTPSCPKAMANLGADLFKVMYSFTACGIPAHAYLSKYGGDVTCSKYGGNVTCIKYGDDGTCSGGNRNQSVKTVLVYLSLYVLGQFL